MDTARPAATPGAIPDWVFSPTPTVQINTQRQLVYVDGAGVFPIAECIASDRTTPRFVQWKDGRLRQIPAHALPLSDLGLGAEQTTRNQCTRTDNLGGDTWKLSGMTATPGQLGPDGSRTATRLTATADGGAILQVPTPPEEKGDMRCFSAFVLASSVSGTAGMTIDGGASWTTLDASNCLDAERQGLAPNAKVFTRAYRVGPVTGGFGFRLARRGDAITVWCPQLQGAITCPDYTSPVQNPLGFGRTKACLNDALSLTGPAFAAVSAGTFPVSMYGAGRVANVRQTIGFLSLGDGSRRNEVGFRLTRENRAFAFVDIDGGASSYLTAPNAVANFSMVKSAATFGPTDCAVCLAGGEVTVVPTTNGLLPPIRKLSVGMRGPGNSPWNEYLGPDLAIWMNTRLADAQLQALTLP